MKAPNVSQYIKDSQVMDANDPSDQMPVPVEGNGVMAQQEGANPFMAPQYQGMPFPDIPITGGSSVIDKLIDDSDVPEEMKQKYWFIFNKDNVLTFLDENRKTSKMLNFDIMKIDILNSIPYYDYTFEKETEFGILRNIFETKLDRALGFKGQNIKNERIVLQSQFSEQRQISEDGHGNVKEGFFKRLLGRR